PATFVKKLSDHSVEPGKSVILEGTYTGTLPISVTWKKDGVSITPSERCSIVTTEKTCILEILSSTKGDAGHYSCEIENEAGRDACEALVSTLEPKKSPFFDIKPVSIDVIAGESADFECHVTGAQPMRITWSKDNKEIRPGGNYTIT
ncbi:hypothetical protein A6R68_02120, partial [Neotoma lepida]